MMLNNSCNAITLVGWYGCRYVVIIRSMFLCAISGAFTGLAISMNNSVPAKEREQNKSTTEIGNRAYFCIEISNKCCACD
jgi:hypothetical protein